jgi:ribosome-binding factor A
MSDRIAKVNKLFKQEVGKLILEDVDFPAGFVVTIMKVDTSADLRYADVYVSVMPKEKADEAISALEENIYAMQQKINKKLFMKPVPMIRFRLDFSGDRSDRINEIINENR